MSEHLPTAIEENSLPVEQTRPKLVVVDFSEIFENATGFRDESRVKVADVTEIALAMLPELAVGEKREIGRFTGLADPEKLIKKDDVIICKRAARTKSFVNDLKMAVQRKKLEQDLAVQIGPQEWLEYDDGSPYFEIRIESDTGDGVMVRCVLSHPDRKASLTGRFHNAVAKVLNL